MGLASEPPPVLLEARWLETPNRLQLTFDRNMAAFDPAGYADLFTRYQDTSYVVTGSSVAGAVVTCTLESNDTDIGPSVCSYTNLHNALRSTAGGIAASWVNEGLMG